MVEDSQGDERHLDTDFFPCRDGVPFVIALYEVGSTVREAEGLVANLTALEGRHPLVMQGIEAIEVHLVLDQCPLAKHTDA